VSRARLLPAVLLLLAALAAAQENPLRPPASTLADLSRNALLGAEDAPGWPELRAKAQRLLVDGEGQVGIVHIGGSHVQADLWSHQLRLRLARLAPGLRGARGLVVPHRLAGSHDSPWMDLTATGSWRALDKESAAGPLGLGLGGRAAVTRDSLVELRLASRDAPRDLPPPPGSTRVSVWHRGDSTYTLDAFSPDAGQPAETVHDPARGITRFRFGQAADTLVLRAWRADSSQARLVLHGLVLEDDLPGFTVHSAGVNGADTGQVLARPGLVADLAELAPDLVILSLGINDAHGPDFDTERFRANYAELIRRVREAAPGAAILLTTNTDSFRHRRANRNGLLVRDVMLELAATEGVAVWDALGVMGGLGSIKEWRRADLAQRDLVHLTRAGYQLLGDLLATALTEELLRGLGPEGRP
jgi:lysophospholipase L1-like esterase